MKKFLTLLLILVLLAASYVGVRYVYQHVVGSPLKEVFGWEEALAERIGLGGPERTEEEDVADVVLPFGWVSPDAGPEHCPVVSARLPQEPVNQGEPRADEAENGRSLGAAMLDDHAQILFTCLGRVAERGEVNDLVKDSVSNYMQQRDEGKVAQVRTPRLENWTNLPEVVVFDVVLDPEILSERFLEHDGWILRIGFLRAAEDDGAYDDVVNAVLESLRVG